MLYSRFLLVIYFIYCLLSPFSCVWFFATLWTVAHQAPLSMGFSRQEYWSGLQCTPPGDLPDPGIMSSALTGGFFTTSTTWESILYIVLCILLVVIHCVYAYAQSLSCVQFFATAWTLAHQASPSMGFSRQECWSGLPCPPPEDLPDPGIEPTPPASPALQADSIPLSHQGSSVMY